MSADDRFILEVVAPYKGRALDLGGGGGTLWRPLEQLGYRYLNVDLEAPNGRVPAVLADAHLLPFKDGSFELVVSKDSLEHFSDPSAAVAELWRVLKSEGRCIIWVPFMHPFHDDDFYRYSPLGLKHLFRDFEIVSLESPLWLFTYSGILASEVLRRLRLGFVANPMLRLCHTFDRLVMQKRQHPAAYAVAYRMIVRKMPREASAPGPVSPFRENRKE